MHKGRNALARQDRNYLLILKNTCKSKTLQRLGHGVHFLLIKQENKSIVRRQASDLKVYWNHDWRCCKIRSQTRVYRILVKSWNLAAKMAQGFPRLWSGRRAADLGLGAFLGGKRKGQGDILYSVEW